MARNLTIIIIVLGFLILTGAGFSSAQSKDKESLGEGIIVAYQKGTRLPVGPYAGGTASFEVLRSSNLLNSEGHTFVYRKERIRRQFPAKHANILSSKDVESLVQSCFDGLFRVGSSSLSPEFVEGDFDGDGIPDVFVPVKLARVVNRNDKSEPPFTFRSVLDPASSSRHELKLKMGDLSVPVVEDPFFAILHRPGGSIPNRCTVRTQKFVLLFAMDKGSSKIELFHGKRLRPGTIYDPKEDQPPPRLRGDAILLLDDKGRGTALYWDGSRYRWYPVN